MSAYHSSWIETDVVYRLLPTGDGETPVYRREGRRVIVCLCGSTRFGEAFRAANLRETLAGRIVLSVGCDTKADGDLFAGLGPDRLAEVKAALDLLHLDKIDLADQVLVLNVGGYVGESTRREVLHARARGKAVRWLEPFKVPPDLAHVGAAAVPNRDSESPVKCHDCGAVVADVDAAVEAGWSPSYDDEHGNQLVCEPFCPNCYAARDAARTARQE